MQITCCKFEVGYLHKRLITNHLTFHCYLRTYIANNLMPWNSRKYQPKVRRQVYTKMPLSSKSLTHNLLPNLGTVNLRYPNCVYHWLTVLYGTGLSRHYSAKTDFLYFIGEIPALCLKNLFRFFCTIYLFPEDLRFATWMRCHLSRWGTGGYANQGYRARHPWFM